MCLKTLTLILKKPVEAVYNAKRKKIISETLWVLLLSWVMIGVGLLTVSLRLLDPLISFAIGIIVLVAGLFFSMFTGYLITKVMVIIGGKGNFFDGLTTVSYTIFPISIAILITSLLALVHPALGVIGFVPIAIQTALGLSLYFRCVKVLYNVDTVTTLVGFFIIVYVLMVSVYLTVSLTSTDIYSMFGQIMMPLFTV